MVIEGVSPERVAEILRAARDLMNSNGKHWIQGSEKTDLKWNEKKQESIKLPYYRYCSIGAIKEVAFNEKERYAAYRALVTKGIPEYKEFIDERFGDEFQDYKWDQLDGYGIEVDDEEIFEWVMSDEGWRLEEIITLFNDETDRDWSEIRDAFTKAAKETKFVK